MTSISLSQLTDRIQEVLKFSFDAPVWIRAEISELRENYNGHCYLELIEKDSSSDAILAKTKATIWSSTYRMLKPYFESSTGESLRAGLNVLVAVTVEFHGVYGFSLNIRDIDPVFTIGELAARRLKIIRQLEADGIADMNKLVEMPLLPQRLAIISSATAAGYDDFMNQLRNDENKFAFYTKLFPAVMQGEQAESSIIRSLEKIYEHAELFDVVVIIRGGGATTDLACFDSYELALNCAQFPLPIISGIGHQRDVSILDMVAHTSVKTPTAAAEFLISKMQEAEIIWQDILADISSLLKHKTDNELRKLDQTKLRIKHTLRQLVMKRTHVVEVYRNRLVNSMKMLIAGQRSKLLLLEKSIESHSPSYLLQHGYTITTLNGLRISSINDIKKGDKIRTFVHDGGFESEVINE
ncbi:MAG: exodeoxyribonuclease VII large subunit [Paludibacteraceae bacterium]|nr:exodeoxyribonuclease VII large subunit [Paludibacteraceae bacterium]